jgi:hypothetical protein
MARPATSTIAFGARPQTSEPMVNSAMPSAKTRRRP